MSPLLPYVDLDDKGTIIEVVRGGYRTAPLHSLLLLDCCGPSKDCPAAWPPASPATTSTSPSCDRGGALRNGTMRTQGRISPPTALESPPVCSQEGRGWCSVQAANDKGHGTFGFVPKGPFR